MPKLINSTKHVAFVKSSFPKAAHDSDNPKVWFCVQAKNGDTVLHVEKRVGGKPVKFKTAAAITAYLGKLNMLPKSGWTVAKDMRICGGHIWMQDGQVHMTCGVKAQGGGKSTLKQVLPLGKKMGFPGIGEIQIVKKAAEPEDERAEAASSSSPTATPEEQKYLKLHLQVTNALGRLPSSGNSDNLDKLERLIRRIEKYQHVKLTKKLARLTPPVTGLSSSELKTQHQTVTALVEQARSAEEGLGAADSATIEAQMELDGAGQTVQFAEFAESLGMSDKDLDGFMKAAEAYPSACSEVFGAFTGKQVKQLYGHMGGGTDWDLFFARVSKAPQLEKLVKDVWGGNIDAFGKALRSRVVNHNVRMLTEIAKERSWDGKVVDAFLTKQTKRAGGELKADLKAQKRKTKASIELFRIEDLGTYLKARAPAEYAVAPPQDKWPISLWYEVEAKNPSQLEHDLDNPVMAQRVKDAGNFDGMINGIVARYKEIVAPLLVDSNAKDPATVASELQAAVATVTESHLEDARKKSETQYGLHAEVEWNKKKRIAKVSFAIFSVFAGVAATIASFATGNVAGGVLGAVGSFKNLSALIHDCKEMGAEVEIVLGKVKVDLAKLKEYYDKYGKHGGGGMEGLGMTLGLAVPKELLDTVTGGALKSADSATTSLGIADTNTAQLEDKANQLGAQIIEALDDSKVARLQLRDLHGNLTVALGKGSDFTPGQLTKINELMPQMLTAQDTLKSFEDEVRKLLDKSISCNQRIDVLQNDIGTCQACLDDIKAERPSWVGGLQKFLTATELGTNILVGGTFSEFESKDWVGWMEVGTASLDSLRLFSSDLDDCFGAI